MEKENIFNQNLFDFFVENHNLHLLNGEILDIKNAVFKDFLNDLGFLSIDELSDLFHATIKEMNKRKAEEQKVDVGFWDSEGVYKEDIQTITPQEVKEIKPAFTSVLCTIEQKIKEIANFHCGVCPQNEGQCDGCCVDLLRNKSKGILREFFGRERNV